MSLAPLRKKIFTAAGKQPADLVLKNAKSLDVFSGTWFTGDIAISGSTIVGVKESYQGIENFDCQGKFLVPGFIDSHVHIESTMMTPAEFAKAVLPHGTTAAIWDPHEIANVFGIPGLRWALASAKNSAIDLFVMLSSCVPSSRFETSGAKISAQDLKKLKQAPHVLGLAEMMDFPSVIAGKKDVLEKIMAFSDMPLDGHSPMLTGKPLNAYLAAGIRTCHEICSLAEAQEKLQKGMRVLIREGSVAKNAADLAPILTDYSSVNCMLCTDDRNPLDIQSEGHLDFIIKIAIKRGISPEVAYRSASFAPAIHYGLKNRGAIAPGMLADILLVDDLANVSIKKVWRKGIAIDSPKWKWPKSPPPPKTNSIKLIDTSEKRLQMHSKKQTQPVHIIDVIPGQIITGRSQAELPVKNSIIQNTNEIQKIAVFERHHGTGNIGIGFVKGFQLTGGAIASSVAHDAHNIGIVGKTDAAIMKALYTIQSIGGGIVVINDDLEVIAQLPLPIAGLMSKEKFQNLIPKIKLLRAAVDTLGCSLTEPFLQMSFLALPVIPSLKITDRGLVDVEAQKIISPLI